ncbi:hypothetical protein RYX36_007496 [Vicia faba]
MDYLDLDYSGASVEVAPVNYDKVSHVLDISKNVVESLCMSNFSISQVNFDMKPTNWGRADDHDLYLMWLLTGNHGMNWDKYITRRMVYCRDTKKAPLFHSSFIQLILEGNGIVPKDDEQFLTPKIFYYGGVSKMRYYRDYKDGSYFYLEEFGIKVYDDKIVDRPADAIVAHTSTTSYGSLFLNLKGYLDELLGRLITDNQIRKDHIMARIGFVSRESEGNRV